MICLKNLPLPCPINALYGVMPVALRRRVVRGRMVPGRVVHMKVLSKRGRQRRDLLVAAIYEQLGGRPKPLHGDVQVAYVITPRDRRTPDIDAYEKHLLDCLQHAGVIENDRHVVQVSKERLPHQSPGHVDVEVWEVG